MLKILINGYFSGIALAAAALLLLIAAGLLLKWLPALGFVLIVVLLVAFVMLLNWAFTPR